MIRTYWIVGLVLVVLLTGCRWVLRPADIKPTAAITEASSGVAGIAAHTQSAERHVQSAAPHSDAEGKVYLKAASDEHKEVLTAASGVKIALGEAVGQVQSLQGQLGDAQAQYARLEGEWYVVWGRRVERALWVIGISWLLGGIASVVLGMGNPLSLTWRIGKEITRLMPAMNLFSWLRDWFLKRKETGTAMPQKHA